MPEMISDLNILAFNWSLEMTSGLDIPGCWLYSRLQMLFGSNIQEYWVNWRLGVASDLNILECWLDLKAGIVAGADTLECWLNWRMEMAVDLNILECGLDWRLGMASDWNFEMLSWLNARDDIWINYRGNFIVIGFRDLRVRASRERLERFVSGRVCVTWFKITH